MAVRLIPNKLVPETDDTAWMELQADAEADLTDLTAFGSFAIAFGSTCQVIDTGDFYTLNSDGIWKNQINPQQKRGEG